MYKRQVALLIIVALVVGAFLILNYDGEKKMTNTTATTDYQAVSYTHLFEPGWAESERRSKAAALHCPRHDQAPENFDLG